MPKAARVASSSDVLTTKTSLVTRHRVAVISGQCSNQDMALATKVATSDMLERQINITR
jgi:hypothetical protein